MIDSNAHGTGSGGSLEGRVFRPTSFPDLAEAIEFAFDYRGDVTLELSSGESLRCYLFNRHQDKPEPSIEVFPETSPMARVILYREIASIAFTGQDTASGKSWEAWVAKKESQRRAEAVQIAEAARARGHL